MDKIAFLSLAQAHQIFHWLPAALRLAREPGVEVHVLSSSPASLDLVKSYDPEGTLTLRRLWTPTLRPDTLFTLPRRRLALRLHNRTINLYPTVVTTELTSAMLRRIPFFRSRMVLMKHGAGDREGSYNPKHRDFDLNLVGGEKHKRKLIARGLGTEDNIVVAGYAKFELVRPPAPIFGDLKPIAFYNPHFDEEVSSWFRHAQPILDEMAAIDGWNFIVAPHVKLKNGPEVDPPLGNVLVDRGSLRSIDMAYTEAAQVYIGDASSQVYEFLRRPRPCIFLNFEQVDWRDRENYSHWRLGQVIERIDQLGPALARAAEMQPQFEAAQRAAFAYSIDPSPMPASERQARAILAFARGEQSRASRRSRMSAPAILYVHDLRASGVVTNAIALAQRLGAERETILCAGFGTGLNREIDVSPARLVVLSDGPEPRDARTVAAANLRRLIATSGAGLVVSMGNLGHRIVLRATLLKRVRRLYRISNEIGRPQAGLHKNFRRRLRHRVLLATANQIVLVGRALAEQPLFARAVRKGNATYIPNGVDVDRARRDALAPSPHPWLGDGGPPVVLTIGRIHAQKNFEGLLDGAALAMRERPMRLIIVGSGDPERIAALKARAHALEISEAVMFAGETSNVFAWLARANLFALVSHWEGSSTALLEAMAVGLPVVASRQAGDAASVLGEGRFGALVDANDLRSIAEGLLCQLGEKAVRPGDRIDEYRLERTHQRYLDLFRAL